MHEAKRNIRYSCVSYCVRTGDVLVERRQCVSMVPPILEEVSIPSPNIHASLPSSFVPGLGDSVTIRSAVRTVGVCVLTRSATVVSRSQALSKIY